MNPRGTSLYELRARAMEVLEEVAENRFRTPESIYEGSMEASLWDASHILRRIDTKHSIVRRPYSNLSTEALLLSRLAVALRLRMSSHGNLNITGLHDFNMRVDRFLVKASMLVTAHHNGQDYI